MKTLSIIISFLFLTIISPASQAQSTKGTILYASLQASGLTCSMCSKAVLESLQEVKFVDKVTVDLKKQEYKITFKDPETVDLDALSKAVQDAGFSVARMKLSVAWDHAALKKDEHLQVGGHYFHFLNANGQTLNGNATVTLVDKPFVPAKEFKKYSAATSMECVKTGKAGSCCAPALAADTRIYHVII